jgi:hypothetical protein
MTETDPVSVTLCSLEYRTMDKVQKSGKPELLFSFLARPEYHSIVMRALFRNIF